MVDQRIVSSLFNFSPHFNLSIPDSCRPQMHLNSEIHAASLACGRGPLFTHAFTVTCKSCYLIDSVCTELDTLPSIIWFAESLWQPDIKGSVLFLYLHHIRCHLFLNRVRGLQGPLKCTNHELCAFIPPSTYLQTSVEISDRHG